MANWVIPTNGFATLPIVSVQSNAGWSLGPRRDPYSGLYIEIVQGLGTPIFNNRPILAAQTPLGQRSYYWGKGGDFRCNSIVKMLGQNITAVAGGYITVDFSAVPPGWVSQIATDVTLWVVVNRLGNDSNGSNFAYKSDTFNTVAPCSPVQSPAAYNQGYGNILIVWGNAGVVTIERTYDLVNWVTVVSEFLGTSYTDNVGVSAAMPIYRMFTVCPYAAQKGLTIGGYVYVYTENSTAYRRSTHFRR